MRNTHIHQGGTLNTYCGAPLAHGDVGWQEADKATCATCLAVGW